MLPFFVNKEGKPPKERKAQKLINSYASVRHDIEEEIVSFLGEVSNSFISMRL